MRRLALVLLAIAAGVGAVFAYLSWSVTSDGVRRAAVERIQALTGYAVEIRGQTAVSVFPTPRFEIRNVVLIQPRPPAAETATENGADANANGQEPGELASIDVLQGSVSLLPLLIGRLEVGDYTLFRPRLTLAVDRHGRANWTTTRQGDVGANVGQRAEDAPPIADVRLGSFRVVDGAIMYVDRRGGVHQEVSAINATVAWPRLAARMEVGGSAVWNGEIVGFGLEADDPLEFMGHGTSRSRLLVESGVVTATFEGNAHFTTDPQLEGRIALTAPSTRALLRWIGTDLGVRAGLDALELSGNLNFLPGSIALSEIALSLDGNEAEGGINFKYGEAGAELQGTLAFETLDLGAYRSAAQDESEAGGSAAVLASPVDLAPLDSIAVDLRVSAASVLYGDLQFGRSAGTLTVRNGTLDIGVGEAFLYGGTAQGTITARPAAKGARVKAALKLDRTDIGPLLDSLTGGHPIEGATTARINLTGNGTNVAEILSDLTGDARLTITDGSLAGINVVALLDMLKSGRVEGWPSSDAETEFDELTTSFIVTEGSASTDDFHMTGPNIEVSAEGEVRLVSASVAGHGSAVLRQSSDDAATNGVEQLSVPFVIEGPIARPNIYPDPVWLLDRADVEAGEVERAREDLKQKSPEEIIDDMLKRGIDFAPRMTPDAAQKTAPQQ